MADDKHIPGLPDVTDEAADSPTWLPALGLGLLVLLALTVLRPSEGDSPSGEAGAEEPAEAAEPADDSAQAEE